MSDKQSVGLYEKYYPKYNLNLNRYGIITCYYIIRSPPLIP